MMTKKKTYDLTATLGWLIGRYVEGRTLKDGTIKKAGYKLPTYVLPTGERASKGHEKVEVQHSFEDAMKLKEGQQTIGPYLRKEMGITVIDLDHVWEDELDDNGDKVLKDAPRVILNLFKQAGHTIEASQSGNGYHIFIVAEKNFSTTKPNFIYRENEPYEIEIYSHGRFIATTSEFENFDQNFTNIKDGQKELDALADILGIEKDDMYTHVEIEQKKQERLSSAKRFDGEGTSVEEVIRCLEGLPEGYGDIRDDWRDIGFALYDNFNGDEIGLDIWDEFSQTRDGYDVGACELQWPSFGKGDCKNKVTMGTLWFKSSASPRKKCKLEIEQTEETKEQVEKNADLFELGYNDLGNGYRFSLMFAGKAVFATWKDQGYWLVWNGKHWEKNDAILGTFAVKLAKAMSKEAFEIEDEDEQSAYLKHINKMKNGAGFKNMFEKAQIYMSKPLSEFDSHPWLLNLQNGVYDLLNGSFGKHDPTHYMTQIAEVNYNPSATCPLWEKSVDLYLSGDAEVIEYNKRFLGYALSGDTSIHNYTFWYGETARNGKSTMATVVGNLMGSYATSVDFAALNKEASATGTKPVLCSLDGARLIVTDELDGSLRINQTFFKKIVSGDAIRANDKYEKEKDLNICGKLLLFGNYKPKATADDNGFWRRLNMINFEYHITTDKEDPLYVQKLEQEREGILNWLLEGVKNLLADNMKLGYPESQRKLLSEYREESDSIAQFFKAHCILGEETSSVAKNLLFANYQSFCKNEGHNTPYTTSIGFGRALKKLGYKDVKRNGGNRFWVGIKLLGF